ncbi:TPR end-of-group domain-containing protein [Pedobacter caeni]|nr:transglutaminase domain-containing protein [Pedobacter caeni]
MKKLLLAIGICLMVTVANAQQEQTASDFEAYAATLTKNLNDLNNKKDYQGLITGLEAYEARYQQLPASVKPKYAGNMPDNYYNLACFYALVNNKDKAISNFGRAAAAGYSNYQHMATDPDLNLLRNDPKFKVFAQQIRDRGDFGYILKKAGKYQVQPEQKSSPFTYQNASDSNLIAFRKLFNLDSIAGAGTEISKFKNLLNWAHNVVKHDGSSSNPQAQNAIDLIAIAKKENRGFNCRMMATILKDAYQAMGYFSRVVTCMPKDTADSDCHVINVVWSKEKKKWLWMDPTFNAYVSNDKGELLSIEEVRSSLIAEKPLVLNEDANWNNQMKQTKANYLDHYMSKNLYWIQVSTKSEWNLETSAVEKKVSYINLYPSQYTTLKGLKVSSGNLIKYATNDPAYFWQAPDKL